MSIEWRSSRVASDRICVRNWCRVGPNLRLSVHVRLPAQVIDEGTRESTPIVDSDVNQPSISRISQLVMTTFKISASDVSGRGKSHTKKEINQARFGWPDRSKVPNIRFCQRSQNGHWFPLVLPTTLPSSSSNSYSHRSLSACHQDLCISPLSRSRSRSALYWFNQSSFCLTSLAHPSLLDTEIYLFFVLIHDPRSLRTRSHFSYGPFLVFTPELGIGVDIRIVPIICSIL